MEVIGPVVGAPANKPRARGPRPKKSKAAPPASQTPPLPTTPAQPQVQGALVSQLQSPAPSFIAPYNALQAPTVMLPGDRMSQPVHTFVSEPATHLVSGRQLVSVPHTANGNHLVTSPLTVNGKQLVTLPQLTNSNPVVTLSPAISANSITIMVTQPMSQSLLSAGLMSAPLATQPQLVVQGATAGHLTTVASAHGHASLLTGMPAIRSPPVVTHVPTSPPSLAGQFPLSNGTLYNTHSLPKANSPPCSTQAGFSSHCYASSCNLPQLSPAPVFQAASQTSMSTEEFPAGSKTVANLLRQRQHNTTQVSNFILMFLTVDALRSEALTHTTGWTLVFSRHALCCWWFGSNAVGPWCCWVR